MRLFGSSGRDEKKFEGGLETLQSVDEAKDAHEAVGQWWARAILSAKFDNGSNGGGSEEDDRAFEFGKALATAASVAGRSDVEARIGGFAEALAYISREQDLRRIGVDYHPDATLREAADRSGMPYNELMTFPWKSSTCVQYGTVTASLGYQATHEQIWPPVDQPSEG